MQFYKSELIKDPNQIVKDAGFVEWIDDDINELFYEYGERLMVD